MQQQNPSTAGTIGGNAFGAETLSNKKTPFETSVQNTAPPATTNSLFGGGGGGASGGGASTSMFGSQPANPGGFGFGFGSGNSAGATQPLFNSMPPAPSTSIFGQPPAAQPFGGVSTMQVRA